AVRSGSHQRHTRPARERQLRGDWNDRVHHQVGDQAVVTVDALPDLGARAQPRHEPIFREAAELDRPGHVAEPMQRRGIIALPARDAERADRADLKVAALDQAEADAVAWAAEALRRAIAADVEQRVGADREILGARKDRLDLAFEADRDGPVVGRWRSLE